MESVSPVSRSYRTRVKKVGVSKHLLVKKKSLISGMSQISLFMSNSEFVKNKAYYISRPLVIMAGIGDYDQESKKLIGVNQDYINMIYTFYHIFGYSIFYRNKDDEIVYIDADNHKEKVSLRKAKQHVKLHWTCEELEKFFEEGKEYVETNKHDSCILIVSSHGDEEGIIIDSEGEEASLDLLFGPYMGQDCPYLIDKPKIAIVDSCRGDMKEKAIVSATTTAATTATTAITTVKTESSATESQPTDKNKGETENKQSKTNEVLLLNNQPTKPNWGLKTPGLGSINEAKELTENDFDDHDEENDEDDDDNFIDTNGVSYHSRANFLIMYANPEGYAALDAGLRGGYLIRAVKNVFITLEISLKQPLDDIVVKIRNQARQAAGTHYAQLVERVSTMTYPVKFRKGKGASNDNHKRSVSILSDVLGQFTPFDR